MTGETAGGRRFYPRWTGRTLAPPANLGKGELATNLLAGEIYLGKGEGMAPIVFRSNSPTSLDLVALAEALDSLRDMAATDADLDAALATIQVDLDTIAQSGTTDAELATAIAPIAQSLSLLASTDATITQGLANLQASIDNLVAATATDQELATAIASVMLLLPIRSAAAPANPPIGQRWIELESGGDEIYDFAWIWLGGEWRSDRLFPVSTGSGRISGNASPRQDLGGLPPWPGLAGYRLIRGVIRANLEGAGTWETKIRKFANAATITNPPWIVGPSISMTAKGVGTYDVVVPTDSLLPQTVCALELNLTKTGNAPDSIFALTTQWAAVRA